MPHLKIFINGCGLTSLWKQTKNEQLTSAKYKYRFPKQWKFSSQLQKRFDSFTACFRGNWRILWCRRGAFGFEGYAAPFSFFFFFSKATKPWERNWDLFFPNWMWVSMSLTLLEPWGLACVSGTESHMRGEAFSIHGCVCAHAFCRSANSTQGIPECRCHIPNENYTFIWKICASYRWNNPLENGWNWKWQWHFVVDSFYSRITLIFFNAVIMKPKGCIKSEKSVFILPFQ